MYLRPFYLLASKNVPLKSAQKLVPIGLINQVNLSIYRNDYETNYLIEFTYLLIVVI